ncbi:MAG: hypothetical protein ACRC7N_14150 [Clostridium sp.]
MYFYRIYGLNILSEINLPWVNQTDINEKIDVEITVSNEEMKNLEGYYYYGKMDGWFRIKDLATFRVIDGNKIIIYKEIDDIENHLEKACVFILGTALGYILIQKGIVAMHGGAIISEEKGALIVGRQGAGKSTAISKLLNLGYVFLADDLSALRINENGQVIVSPAFPQRKLCRDGLVRMGLDVSKYELYDEIRDKFNIPSDEFFCNEEREVDSIYYLEWVNEEEFKKIGEDVNNGIIEEEINPINIEYKYSYIIKAKGLDKVKIIMDNIFRIEIIRQIGIEQEYFKKCIAIANKVSVFIVKRYKK